MSHILSHEPCPFCRKGGRDQHGDNLAHYSDGHKWCFSCNYYEWPGYKEKIMHQEVDNIDKSPVLPSDATSEIDFAALTWLAKYEITRDEVVQYAIKWSPSRKWLLFPIYSSESILLMYQAKTFAPFPNGNPSPKYITYGVPEKIISFIHQKELDKDGNIIVVEDMVSAIKISRQFTAMPLFGSILSQSKLGRMQFSSAKNLVLWLDYDKRKHSFITSLRTRSLGFTSSIIVTAKDPKEYNDQEIADFVTPCIRDKVLSLPDKSSCVC